MSDRADTRIAEPLTVVGQQYELTFEEFTRIPELANGTIRTIDEFLKHRGVQPSGPNVFEYRFHDDPHGPRRIARGRFTLTLGVPVAGADVPPQPLELIELLPLKYIEIITNSFGDEWRQIRDLAERSGFERTLVEREVYHFWHGERHPETKIALQVGIK